MSQVGCDFHTLELGFCESLPHSVVEQFSDLCYWKVLERESAFEITYPALSSILVLARDFFFYNSFEDRICDSADRLQQPKTKGITIQL
jgi:hypothetical protein